MAERFDGDARIERLNAHGFAAGGRCVVYWMQNAQRPWDNPALDAAVRLANEHGVGVVTYFALDASVPHASARTFTFLIDGLRETMADLHTRGVATLVRVEPPVEGVVQVAEKLKAVAVTTDFSPLRRGRGMRAEDDLLARLGVDMGVPPALDAKPGPRAARVRHRTFVKEGLKGYATNRRAVDGAGAGISAHWGDPADAPQPALL